MRDKIIDCYSYLWRDKLKLKIISFKTEEECDEWLRDKNLDYFDSYEGKCYESELNKISLIDDVE